jgi:CBS domain-containing protein
MPLEKRVWEAMDPNFETVTPETPLKEACVIMTGTTSGKKGKTVLGLVVMRSSGEYLGLLTTKEILKYFIYLYNKLKREGKGEDWASHLSDQGKGGSLVTVNDILVFHEVFARPNQSVFEAIRIMEEYDLEILPVADGGKIIGVIRSDDILIEFARKVHGKNIGIG